MTQRLGTAMTRIMLVESTFMQLMVESAADASKQTPAGCSGLDPDVDELGICTGANWALAAATA